MKHCSVEIIKELTRDERIREIYQGISGIQIRQEEDYSKHDPLSLSVTRLIDTQNQAKKIGPTDPDSEKPIQTRALILGSHR